LGKAEIPTSFLFGVYDKKDKKFGAFLDVDVSSFTGVL
jgi:hypothetical protein